MNASPSLSRRHAAGSASARSLLFTVLGEFVLPAGETAWTSAFIAAFARLGVEEKATRQALMRTAEDGWVAGAQATRGGGRVGGRAGGPAPAGAPPAGRRAPPRRRHRPHLRLPGRAGL